MLNPERDRTQGRASMSALLENIFAFAVIFFVVGMFLYRSFGK